MSFRTLRGVNTIHTNAGWATIGGGYGNTVQSNAIVATIGGGSYNTIGPNASRATIGGGSYNTNRADSGTIGGSQENNIAADSFYASIAGGQHNDIGTNSSCGAIGGGDNNNIADFSQYATIAAGYWNDIGTLAGYSAIGGGYNNHIAANSQGAAIAGGSSNDIAANAQYATIPGGRYNSAASYALAAGYNAKATNQGAFVWSDSTGTITGSTNNNLVTFRASGGYRFFTDTGNSGAYLAAGSGSWTSTSDRNAKEHFHGVEPRAVLEKVAALPVQTWNYKSQDTGIRHIGPVAQDFKAAFQVGETDTGIATVDADGVALAAIQGLNQKLEEQRAENAALKQRLERLEQLLRQRTGGGQ